MSKLQIILATSILLLSGEVGAAIIIGPTVNPVNNHTYLLLDQSNWVDAELEAISLGGHLVTVNDEAEENWILSTFSPNRERHLWTGLNDADIEGSFTWSSGELSSFRGFPPGEPNNFGGNEDYVYIDVAHSDGWNDLASIDEQIAPGGFYIPLHGVVEIPVTQVPEPQALLIFGTGILGLIGFSKRRKAA